MSNRYYIQEANVLFHKTYDQLNGFSILCYDNIADEYVAVTPLSYRVLYVIYQNNGATLEELGKNPWIGELLYETDGGNPEQRTEILQGLLAILKKRNLIAER